MVHIAHASDLRKGRFSAENRIYHVSTATNLRKPYFGSFAFGRTVVHEMMNTSMHDTTQTLAFVVMPDHIHWLFSLTSSRTLSSVVGTVKRNSARKINQMTGNPGFRIWQRGYYDHAMRSDEDVVVTARYIIANSLRAGLVSDIREYPLWDAIWL